MLVVAIIGLVASMAMPVAKKYRTSSAERDYIADFSDLVSSARAYYLVHNEWPEDSSHGTLPLKLRPYLPTRFVGPISTSISTLHRRAFNASPLLAGDLSVWDYENWLSRNLGIRIGVINIVDSALNAKALELAQNFFPASEVERIYLNVDRITYIFKESPSSGDNRYF